ncbi:MAG: 2-amino-4-hydroxy-6-hydroxymethyldihydropteridin epyrophosphokinae [Pseudonocardiales bacterium]|nr:2-amino-4-hydroxy-6-hydroxymethyldihydropteridin epyrophosphokinae [Pseudonocardiales bacterium]
MSIAVLSIGSNLGDRAAILAGAIAQFRPWLTALSPVYETAPWGPVPQGDYLNAVLVVDDPTAEPGDWLTRAHEAERSAGRTRDVRFGPRTLDVDVVSVDDVRSTDPVLTLPHPRAEERAFVLVPWLAADPEAVLPGVGRVAALLARLDPADISGVRLRADLVLGSSDPGEGSSL